MGMYSKQGLFLSVQLGVGGLVPLISLSGYFLQVGTPWQGHYGVYRRMYIIHHAPW